MALTKTDSGEYVLDEEILLEEKELKQLSIFDTDEAIEEENLEKAEKSNVIQIDDKIVRRKYFEAIQSMAQVYLEDSNKKGYEMKKLEKPLTERITPHSYLEIVIYLCAAMAKYKQLDGFLLQNKREPNNASEVEAKKRRLKALINKLLDKALEVENELYGVSNTRRELVDKIAGTDSRTQIKRKMKKDFVNNNEIWLI